MIATLLMLWSTTGWSQSGESDSTRRIGKATNEVPDDAGSITEGQSLFGQHCTVCHAVGKQVIGPALASVHNRRPIDWLVNFIQNSQQVIINEEDEYAQYLYEQYDRQVMPNFEFLSRDEILDILAYIRVASASTTAGASSVTETQAEMAQDGPSDKSVTNASLGPERGGTPTLTIVLIGIILVLMLIIIVLATRKRTRTNA